MATTTRSGAEPVPATVTAATRPRPVVVEPIRRRPGITARVRIMAWLLLLLFTVLLAVAVFTRNLLLADVDAEIEAALLQESQEFDEFADVGLDPDTGEPFTNARRLLDIHLERQRPADDEVQVGVNADGSGAQPLGLPSRQDAMTQQVIDQILADRARTGSVDSPEGELRWARTAIDRADDGAVDGYFIVGHLVDPPRSRADAAVRTLALVSGLGLLLAASASWIVAGQILAPVRLVRRAAEEITEDDFTRRIPVTGNDDIAALSDRFNAMLDRLEGAFATQREFVDDAGHELRTPITIIRGNLEVMGDDPDERAEVVRLCTDELDRMSRIVEDLLILAKSERPDFVRPGKVELAELTSDVDAKVRALGDRRWWLEAIGEGIVRVDAQRVTQAVVQFAQNAVQHTHAGDIIGLGSALRDGTVSFWISDTGPGVRAEDAESIFERFSRGSTGGARDYRSGAGLGLAIVRAIAEAHGGYVRLDSVPGQGATFSIQIPAAPASPRDLTSIPGR